MNDILYYILSAVIVCGVLIGIKLMSSPKTAVVGNLTGAVFLLLAVVVTLIKFEIISVWGLWISLAAGTVIGLYSAYKVKMIQMPQMVSLLNGFGGAASALVGFAVIITNTEMAVFETVASILTLIVGSLTFFGSAVAAGKLMGKLPQKPVKVHNAISYLLLAAMLCVTVYAAFDLPAWLVLLGFLLSAAYGTVFAFRVGGADMPITISLLNSLSGVAGAIAGLSISDPLLVAISGIVGASGLILTQIMCKAMNRKLGDILSGKTSAAAKKSDGEKKETQPVQESPAANVEQPAEQPQEEPAAPAENPIKTAKKVIIVPGYGMALGQAQSQVKRLADLLEKRGAEVNYAIHPVAGRMPGHMNVLLAEVDVPYEKLLEMDEVNPMFDTADVAIVVGANDVVNPAASTAVDTPIYGLPVLNVERAKHIIICNFNDKPGYAGVPNPLYTKKTGVTLMWGNAADSLEQLISEL